MQVESWYKLSEVPYYQELFNNVATKERQFNDTHYAFYNAFSNEWRVPQDLYLKLYAKFHPGSADIKDFRCARWLPVHHVTPKELLKKEFLEHRMISDNEWRVKANMLSANLALFGNVGFPGECTFEYFLNAKSNTKVNPDIFKAILATFGADDKYISQINELADIYLVADELRNGKEPQTLSQIFIPKQMADQVAYVAWVQGVPYEEKLANWVMSQSQTQFGKTPLYSNEELALKKGVQTLKTSLQDVRQLFKDKQTQHPLFKQILEGIEAGKYHISTILDEYKAEPFMVPGLNHLQARLIVTPACVGNVEANVQVFDYDRIPQANKDAYNEELDSIVDQIFAERVAAGTQVVPETNEQRQAAERKLKEVCYAEPRKVETTKVEATSATVPAEKVTASIGTPTTQRKVSGGSTATQVSSDQEPAILVQQNTPLGLAVLPN